MNGISIPGQVYGATRRYARYNVAIRSHPCDFDAIGRPRPLRDAKRVPPAVEPVKLMSEARKPTTSSLNTTVKVMGEAKVGSAWPTALLIVTVGAIES